MADIELVIKIPEDVYNYIKANGARIPYHKLTDAIKNGTPLPKGHERLIAEPTEDDIAKTVGGRNDFAECIRDAVRTTFANAPTIIEADNKDGEE